MNPILYFRRLQDLVGKLNRQVVRLREGEPPEECRRAVNELIDEFQKSED